MLLALQGNGDVGPHAPPFQTRVYAPWYGFEPAGITQDSGGAVWQVNLRHAHFVTKDKATGGECCLCLVDAHALCWATVGLWTAMFPTARAHAEMLLRTAVCSLVSLAELLLLLLAAWRGALDVSYA